MKFSSALSLGIAPLAMAKAVHNVYPVRRDVSKRSPNTASSNGVPADTSALVQLGMSGAGITQVQGVHAAEVIIIWVNGGNGAATTQINSQQTVTVTQTVIGGAPALPGQATGAPAVPPPPPSGTVPGVPGTGTTHTVTVGGPKGLSFEPQETTAAIGDMVIFTYLSQNHTVTQSAFDTPCDPLAGGMDSGFQANPNNTVNPAPQVAMQVMVDSPLWFYCRQANHCGKGMVFSINAKPDKTHAMFQGLAIAQKGNGAGSAITGNAPAGAAPPAPAPAAPGAPAGTLAPLPAAPGAPAATGPVQGAGTLNGDGSCSCAVVCGAGSFPAVQAQGVGAFGGMAGSLPATMVGM